MAKNKMPTQKELAEMGFDALKYFPDFRGVNRGDMADVPNAVWLECRAHGTLMKNGKPVYPIRAAKPGEEGYLENTLGGSDLAVAMGISPYKTAPELFYEKKGTVPRQSLDGIADILWMGHAMEKVLGEYLESKTGLKLLKITNMFQHPDYPWFLADFDGLAVDENGELVIVEYKTCRPQKKDEWGTDEFPTYPEYYETQVRGYMATANVNRAVFVACWGITPSSDIVIRWVDRDLDKEKELFDNGQAFIDSLVNDEPPTMSGVDPEKALAALARLFKGDKALPSVELSGDRFVGSLEGFFKIDEEYQKSKALTKKLEDARKAFLVPLVEAMGEHLVGEMYHPDTNKKYIIRCTVSNRRGIDRKALAEKYPDIATEFETVSVSKSYKIVEG